MPSIVLPQGKLQLSTRPTDYTYIRSETHWYRVGNKFCTAIYTRLEVLEQRWRDNADPAPNICTNFCKN